MVATPGVASARSNPFSFTTIPIISGSSKPAGREAFKFRHHLFTVRHLLHVFGETKLTASRCLNPRRSVLSNSLLCILSG